MEEQHNSRATDLVEAEQSLTMQVASARQRLAEARARRTAGRVFIPDAVVSTRPADQFDLLLGKM